MRMQIWCCVDIAWARASLLCWVWYVPFVFIFLEKANLYHANLDVGRPENLSYSPI